MDSQESNVRTRFRRIFAAVQILQLESSTKELLYAGIQITGGVALAAYTYEKGTYGNLPHVSSAIAAGGTYKFFKLMQKDAFIDMHRSWSPWEFARGAFTYSAGLYAFSKCFERNDRMWIPCLALAASGYYFTTSSIKGLDSMLNRRPFLKCCQLMYEPALVACGAAYLFYFRNHAEGWLKCLPFLVTAAAGFNLADRGCCRFASTYHRKLLKGIEMWMGGCILCISCGALTIYSSTNYWLGITVAMSFCSFYGAFVAFDSLAAFQGCVEMPRRVFYCICGMISGPILFLVACLGFIYIRHVTKLPFFLVVAGTGIHVLGDSILKLHRRVPLPVFIVYYKRVNGPVLTVFSSLYAGYCGYHLGWRFALPAVPFIAAGAYATYDGFTGKRIVWR